MSDATPESRLTILLIVGIVVIGSNSFVLSPILTDVADSLATTPVTVARVISAYGATTAISAFLFGGQIDRLGPRPVLVGSFALMTVALLGSAVSGSWRMLASCQALAGLAAGILLPAIYTTAMSAAPDGREARVLARVLNGWALSLVAGVPISAVLTEHGSWRIAYAALALLALVATIGFLALRRTPRRAAAAAAISPVRALRTPGVPGLLGICLCYMTAFYGTFAFLGDHLRSATGLSTTQAGGVVLAYGIGFAIAGAGGRHLDRFGPARVFPAVLVCVAVVYLVLPVATATFASALAIAGAWGTANHFGLNILVILLSARRPGARGAILGLHSTVTHLAVFAGPLTLGVLYGRAGFEAVAFAAGGILLSASVLALGPKRRAERAVVECAGPE